MLDSFLTGAITITHWAVAYFFLRFGKKTGERLFLAFAVAFWLLGTEHIVPLFLPLEPDSFLIYSFRLVGFALIIAAIVNKNRS